MLDFSIVYICSVIPLLFPFITPAGGPHNACTVTLNIRPWVSYTKRSGNVAEAQQEKKRTLRTVMMAPLAFDPLIFMQSSEAGRAAQSRGSRMDILLNPEAQLIPPQSDPPGSLAGT